MKLLKELKDKEAWFYTAKCDITDFCRYCVAPVAASALP